MEIIDKRLETLSPKRQQQFERIYKRNIEIVSPKTEEAKQEIIEFTKSTILQYLANEEKEKIVARKHGSKGKKHREKGPEQVERIKKKLEAYGVNHALMISEVFGVDLKKKYSYQGIRYIGLCPFHKETTPSLSIAPDIDVIKCYGCGKGHTSEYLLVNMLNIKYSRALGMLEKYIFTPEESAAWKQENERIKNIFQITPEQIARRDFIRFRREHTPGIPSYLPEKNFDEEYGKRRDKQKKNKDDQLPF